ncbi:MAG: copper chaperone PCu(A)C [Kiloniellales bacterium]
MTKLVLFALFLLLPLSANAHEFTVQDITVDHPWARATAGQAPNGAAYFVLSNDGAKPDYLVSVAGDVAKRVELHQHSMSDGVMQMRKVEEIEVSPGDPTVLEPGGLHVMLIGLKAPLKQGESFPLTLTFKQAGEVTVTVTVDSVGAMGPAKTH